jgi:hypothetical protein
MQAVEEESRKRVGIQLDWLTAHTGPFGKKQKDLNGGSDSKNQVCPDLPPGIYSTMDYEKQKDTE